MFEYGQGLFEQYYAIPHHTELSEIDRPAFSSWCSGRQQRVTQDRPGAGTQQQDLDLARAR